MLRKFGFGQKEESLIKRLNKPAKIQKFIDESIEYDPVREDRSVLDVIRDQKAECYNGALFAYTCLKYHGYDTSLIELIAREDEEHILAVYKINGSFGSIAQSKFQGLKSRHPMYLSIRDLAVSYMEFYISFDGRYSLASYSDWFDLAKYKQGFLNDSGVVTKIAGDIRNSKHFDLTNSKLPHFLATPKRFWSEVEVIPPNTKIPPYLKFKRRGK